MKTSETIAELAKALSAFQGGMKSVPKGKVNPYFHSKYADLDAIWDTCRKPLLDNGLALVQTTIEIEGKIFLDTTLLHTSGEYITGRYPITPMRQAKDQGWVSSDDPQSLGSAITYARRYAMSAMLGISAEDDDDAERSMKGHREAATRPAARRAPQSDAQVDAGIAPGDDSASHQAPEASGEVTNVTTFWPAILRLYPGKTRAEVQPKVLTMFGGDIGKWIKDGHTWPEAWAKVQAEL